MMKNEVLYHYVLELSSVDFHQMKTRMIEGLKLDWVDLKMNMNLNLIVMFPFDLTYSFDVLHGKQPLHFQSLGDVTLDSVLLV